MAGSAYFILEGDGSDGLGTSIATAGNFDGNGGPESFIVGTRNTTGVGAIIYTGVDSGIDRGFPSDASSLETLAFTTLAGEGTGSVVIGGSDFNGDGISDVAISAPLANGENGAVYVVYGGNAAPSDRKLDAGTLDGTTGTVVQGFVNTDTTSTGFGGSLASNSVDGTLYIGGPTFGAEKEGGVVGVSLGTTPPASVLVTAYDTNGANGEDGYGTSIAAGFDIDGDGVLDQAIGSPGADNTGSNAGIVTIITNSGTITLTGEAATDAAGTVVSAAGDLNGDGFDDLMITAPLNGTGSVYVLFGRDGAATPFADTYDLGSLSATDGITLSGDAGGSNAGLTATNVGDVSGDGIDDILIGGLQGDGRGVAYLVFGSAGIGSFNLSALDGINGYIISDIDLGPFGDTLTVGGIGDVNNDKINDFAIGAPDAGAAGNGQVLGLLGGTENLIGLDGQDGEVDGKIDASIFLDGMPPEVIFIATDDSVTFDGTTTGAIDLRLGETSAEGTIWIADTDTTGADTFDTLATGNEGTGTYGSLKVEDNGIDDDLDRWIYTLGGESLLFLGAGETVLDQVILTASNDSLRAINITITGEDDPTVVTLTPDPLAVGLTTEITEDFASVSGDFAITDPDQNDNPDLSGQTLDGAYGTLIISADGSRFTYILDPDLPDPANDLVETFSPPEMKGASFSLTIAARDEGDIPDTGAAYTLQGATEGDGVTAFFGGGNEFITGTVYADIIDSGAGDDTVNGGIGNDVIVDAFGNDHLSGGEGNDDITAYSGANTIDDAGGDTTDINYFKGGVGRDTITGGAGQDFIDGDAASNLIGAADRLDGGAGDDYLRGGLGTDVFVFKTGHGHDTIADFDVDDSGSGFAPSGALGRDFTVGLDLVDLSEEGLSSLDGLITEVDGHAVLTLSINDTLTFHGVTADELTADSFILNIV